MAPAAPGAPAAAPGVSAGVLLKVVFLNSSHCWLPEKASKPYMQAELCAYEPDLAVVDLYAAA